MATTRDKKGEEQTKFSPSINIIRDVNASLNYIATPNSKQVFTQIINDYQIGVRSFTMIGAYGIGKSAFLWAFEKNINRQHVYFSQVGNIFGKTKGFDAIRLVGEYGSFRMLLAQELGVKKADYTTKDILSALEKSSNIASKSGKGIMIIVDEFGKFLEYAAKNNPESELYFLQQLSEFVNDTHKNIFFITSLHQDFNGYARNLTASQQNEWDKVKGRFKEIAFNEPVEQLLFLASERLPKLKLSVDNSYSSKLFKSIETAKAFPLRDYFSEDVAKSLLPFDILSAAILTLSLQKYGQNERSLFSFIESNDPLGIRDFKYSNNEYYNIANVYDYLIQNFYSFLTTKYNPNYTQWAAIRTAIETVEGMDLDTPEGALKLVKTIGLLNIFASASAKIDIAFLSDYAKYAMGISQPEKIIKKLEGLRIIRFVKHANKFILFEGTDLDIELAIDEAGNLVEKVTNIVFHLNKHFEFPFVSAKAAHYVKGTPRFFAFHLSESPASLFPSGEIDGYINLIFSDSLTEDEVREFSAINEEAILYGLYKSTEQIRNELFEIVKIEKVRENNSFDRIAVRELNAILEHHVKLLNHYVWDNIYTGNSNISWYFRGVKEDVEDQRSFNRLLSNISNAVYPNTPVYKNEMVNKTKLSGALAVARKNLLKNLTEYWTDEDLGFDRTKFPPEKTVYLSLLRDTGLHKEGQLGSPLNESFSPLWAVSCAFLDSSRTGKRNLKEFSDILLSKPFKLKKGFVDFWLPIFLFARRDDFALFGRDGYIPILTDGTLDLISRDPDEYEIKAFDIEGVKLDIFNRYRALLNQSESQRPTTDTFIETIRPFLTFYRELPAYTKNTKRLDKRTLALRDAIAFSKSPEETFFDHFPRALGFTIPQLQKSEKELRLFVTQLQQSIREIRGCFDELTNEFEKFIQEEIVGDSKPFPEYKIRLQNRFQHLKAHHLLTQQRVFLQRLNSELDDKNAWLNSMVHASIGKSLENITDEEWSVLLDKFKDIISELDNLSDITKSGFDRDKEIAIKFEVTSFVEGLQRNMVRLPKSKQKELIKLQGEVKKKLSGDRRLDIAMLAQLLEELIKDEK